MFLFLINVYFSSGRSFIHVMSFGDIEFYDDQNAPKSLYVGHLHPKVSEELLSELFSKYGDISSCKVFPETPGQDPYAFVEFKKREDADHARAAMNERRIFDKNIVVRFATNKTNQKRDLSNDYHIFVGDLSPEIQATDLAKAFQSFGKITSVRIMKDNNTGKSKGFAFLSFSNRTEAEKAIEDMSGQFIGSRQIRTNWASRKGPGDGETTSAGKGPGFKQISYSDALGSSTPTNTTVYFGNLPEQVSDTDLRELVNEHGTIVDVKLFADKRYAFIRMATHEEAAMCICKLHGHALRETYIKCFWGKEYTGNNAAPGGTPQQFEGGYNQGYGQHQNYNQYVQNYWNQYYSQYYQYMDPSQQNQQQQFGGQQYGQQGFGGQQGGMYYGPQGGPPGQGGPPQGAPAQGGPPQGPPQGPPGGPQSGPPDNSQYYPPTQQYGSSNNNKRSQQSESYHSNKDSNSGRSNQSHNYDNGGS